MENCSNNNFSGKMKCFCKSMCRMRLKKDYSLDFSIYDPEASDQSKTCSHSLKGNSDENLAKLVGAIMLITIFCTAMCAIKNCCCKSK